MKFLTNLSKAQKTAWVLVTTVVLVVVIGIGDMNAGDTSETRGGNFDESGSPTQSRTAGHGEASAQRGEQEVRIYDQGLDMVMSTVRIPPKWTVQQDIAYNPNGGLDRFMLVTIGPRNQVIRSYAGMFPYGTINNVSFEQAIRQAIDHVLADENLVNVRFSDLNPDRSMESDPRYQAMVQRLAARGQGMEGYDTEFTGERGGKRYQGQIIFNNMFQPQGGFGILQPTGLLFSLAEDFAELQQVARRIRESLVPNLEHDQAMAQISHEVQQRSDAYSRQMMDQSAIAHQKRMADRQAAFNSHQKSMADLNQLQDVAHESYMKTLRSSGSFSSVGSDYSSHDALIDQTHERTTFRDPWAESEINLDGQYEYNYTNGLGDYYRTNDPGFEPASLQGDWQSIDPLNP